MKKRLRVPRGRARDLRRAQWARIRRRLDKSKPWIPTFAQFAENPAWHKQIIVDDGSP